MNSTSLKSGNASPLQLKVLLGLILCNLIWSAHPLMGKWVLEDFSPPESAWLRYTGALIALLFLIPFTPPKTRVVPTPVRWSLRDLGLVAFLGSMTFCFSPLLQFTGLHASRATDNALIIAIEPLITVAIAWLYVRQTPSRGIMMSFVGALIGFFFLAGLPFHSGDLAAVDKAHFFGNIILLISLTGEAFYSAGGVKLLSRGHSPLVVHALANIAGVIGLTVAVAVLVRESPAAIVDHVIRHVHLKSGVGFLWLGPLGTTATYLYWMYALRGASVASLALTLFIQPIFGTIWGYAFLDERLTALQAIGGLMIIAAVFAQSVGLLKK